MSEKANNQIRQADITADAVALQERDEFCAAGWLKLLAPAKVNLCLAIGERLPNGYHEALSVMQALNLHDVMYMRRKLPTCETYGNGRPEVRLVACGDVAVPDVQSDDNLAARAVLQLASALERDAADAELELRIEKNIPFQGGLGGASTDAAAALVGAARLWGIADDDPALEEVARGLGADVAFFLHGGCSLYEGVGDAFVRALEPSKRTVVLVKPEGGVSTPAAYRAFDQDPVPVSPQVRENVLGAERADDVMLFNNLAPAAESLMPELGTVAAWLEGRPGVSASLLCGSGATTFALCDDFTAACQLVADARNKGWWARMTSFGSVRAMCVGGMQ